VRLARVWRFHVIVLTAVAAAWVYIALRNTLDPGRHHQRLPGLVELVAGLAVVAAVTVFLMVKGRWGGVEIGADQIVVRRCWLPNRRFGWDEVQGYVRVHHYTGGNGSGASLKLTYLAVLLTTGYHVKTEGLATISGSMGTTSKTMMRLNDAESQLRELGLRYRSARHTSMAAWILHRGGQAGHS
jgi:hypothetical protein